jgi:glutamate/tyrosine decarboxylase-like PLP-dependent enzyme
MDCNQEKVMDEHLLVETARKAMEYLKRLPHAAIGVSATKEKLLSLIRADLPETGESPESAIESLVTGVEHGLIHSGSPRYFGFVIGGSTPVSIAADWLTTVWDQNAQVYGSSPAAAVIEQIVAKWVLELLGLPESAGVGFVTGAQMANFTALAIARNTVLGNHGWDFDSNGLQGAPHLRVICATSCHSTVRTAIRMIGLGAGNIETVATDREGRMEVGALKQTLCAGAGPTIVCAQAGNVNTGAFDPIADIAELTRGRGAWLHIDGAFGLWAASSPGLKHLVAGVERADSWATDAHKWLNVPYDSGLVIVRRPENHLRLKVEQCAYAGTAEPGYRNGSEWVPENSRRARAFVLYATLRTLGKKGVRQIVENDCAMASLFATELARHPSVNIVNQVVLNQILFRVAASPDTNDDFHARVANRIQQTGVCWIGTTKWDGKTVLRISVSNWATTEADVNASVESIREAIAQEKAITPEI